MYQMNIFPNVRDILELTCILADSKMKLKSSPIGMAYYTCILISHNCPLKIETR